MVAARNGRSGRNGRNRPNRKERYFLLVFQGMDEEDPPIDSIGRVLFWKIQQKLAKIDPAGRENRTIDLWLFSPGGDANAAYKIVLLLRHYAATLRVVVPDLAKSAATLLSIGMDEIFMAPGADFGPLDVQISHPDKETVRLSGLNVVGALEFITSYAGDFSILTTHMAIKTIGLARLDAMREVMEFTSDMLSPVVAKLDPNHIHRAKSQLKVAKEYAVKLLMARNVQEDKKLSQEKCEELADALIREYPDHGFVIDRTEVEEFGLPIKGLEDYDFQDVVDGVYSTFISTGQRIVNLLDEETVVKCRGKHENVQTNDEEEGGGDATQVQGSGAENGSGGRSRHRARSAGRGQREVSENHSQRTS
jgi:hypothetical protein